ncbi:hypothetical protein J3E71DRAFT_341853 [Bipolaris maydis]|nr:hypothetical protein J3E71DRAFT_341853 [Bipolaris maydis]
MTNNPGTWFFIRFPPYDLDSEYFSSSDTEMGSGDDPESHGSGLSSSSEESPAGIMPFSQAGGSSVPITQPKAAEGTTKDNTKPNLQASDTSAQASQPLASANKRPGPQLESGPKRPHVSQAQGTAQSAPPSGSSVQAGNTSSLHPKLDAFKELAASSLTAGFQALFDSFSPSQLEAFSIICHQEVLRRKNRGSFDLTPWSAKTPAPSGWIPPHQRLHGSSACGGGDSISSQTALQQQAKAGLSSKLEASALRSQEASSSEVQGSGQLQSAGVISQASKESSLNLTGLQNSSKSHSTSSGLQRQAPSIPRGYSRDNYSTTSSPEPEVISARTTGNPIFSGGHTRPPWHLNYGRPPNETVPPLTAQRLDDPPQATGTPSSPLPSRRGSSRNTPRVQAQNVMNSTNARAQHPTGGTKPPHQTKDTQNETQKNIQSHTNPCVKIPARTQAPPVAQKPNAPLQPEVDETSDVEDDPVANCRFSQDKYEEARNRFRVMLRMVEPEFDAASGNDPHITTADRSRKNANKSTTRNESRKRKSTQPDRNVEGVDLGEEGQLAGGAKQYVPTIRRPDGESIAHLFPDRTAELDNLVQEGTDALPMAEAQASEALELDVPLPSNPQSGIQEPQTFLEENATELDGSPSGLPPTNAPSSSQRFPKFKSDRELIDYINNDFCSPVFSKRGA